MMNGKGELSKIIDTICNVLIELVDIYNALSRPVDSNVLITRKIKRDLKYRGYVYFKPFHPCVIQALKYLKSFSFTKTFLFQKVCQVVKF